MKRGKLSKIVLTIGMEERQLQNTIRTLMRRQVVFDEKAEGTKCCRPLEDCSGTGTKLFILPVGLGWKTLEIESVTSGRGGEGRAGWKSRKGMPVE